MSWHTFWSYDVLYDTDIPLDSVTTFWRHNKLSICNDILLTSWHSFHIFLCYDVLVEVMTYFWTSRHTFWWCIKVIFDVMTYFLITWLSFGRYDVFLKSWHTSWYHNILFDVLMYFTHFLTCDIELHVYCLCITYSLISWHSLHTFWRYDVHFDDIIYILILIWNIYYMYMCIYVRVLHCSVTSAYEDQSTVLYCIDIMTCIVTLWRTLWRIFWRHDVNIA